MFLDMHETGTYALLGNHSRSESITCVKKTHVTCFVCFKGVKSGLIFIMESWLIKYSACEM